MFHWKKNLSGHSIADHMKLSIMLTSSVFNSQLETEEKKKNIYVLHSFYQEAIIERTLWKCWVSKKFKTIMTNSLIKLQIHKMPGGKK